MFNACLRPPSVYVLGILSTKEGTLSGRSLERVNVVVITVCFEGMHIG